MYTLIHTGTIFHYFGDDSEMAVQMVEVILETNLKDLMELPALYDNQDFKTIRTRCHKGKSTMSYIGALQVRKILEEIEKEPETAYPQHRTQLHDDLEKVDEELRYFLKEQKG
jgi:HPt (histidine-containing phosphotransfer) domain-containing protein